MLCRRGRRRWRITKKVLIAASVDAGDHMYVDDDQNRGIPSPAHSSDSQLLRLLFADYCPVFHFRLC